METIAPECCTRLDTPCSEKDWVSCAKCSLLVCLIHDPVIPVRHSVENSAILEELCIGCAIALFEAGELAVGNECCYIARKF
jgi:hypothetical protein